LKVSTNVDIAMQCFENFGRGNAPNAPLVARLVQGTDICFPSVGKVIKIITKPWLPQIKLFQEF